jgi:hypothetical protein
MIDFYIYVNDLEARQQEIIQALKSCNRNGETPPVIRPADADTFFRLPDLSAGGISFKEPHIVQMCSEILGSIRIA